MPVDDKPIRRGSRAKPGADEEDIMEKDLADDAVWKRIQQNTFTRWANEHLRTVNKFVTDLGTDFTDGLRLIALVEVLAGKKLPPYNKRPKVRAQKLENVNIAIQFLKNEEKIRIVNIVNKFVTDLGTDFTDGLRLIALVEVLAGKKLPPYNKRPKVRAQKLENVNIAIQFLKNEEKIRIVNI
ncbi:unnamed protein product, partial [Medioppia subpectinata]